jgi:NAD(P)H-nitrite reductase large subunit
MKKVNWNVEKEQLLKETRNIDLERVATMIEDNEILGVYDVPSRPGQKMFAVNYDGYAICVPFVENEEEIFIKTAYNSRKLSQMISEKRHE